MQTVETRYATLTVVDRKGKRSLYHCAVCAQDPELFGDGNFWAYTSKVQTMGRTPCGCSKRPNWTERQQRIRCQREADRRGYTFNGWAEPFHGAHTRLSLECPKHGAMDRTIISSFMSGRGCKACGTLATAEKRSLTQDQLQAKLDHCGYPPGSTLEPMGNKQFIVFCATCATDRFAQAGLCDGAFRTNASVLRDGKKSCRCGEQHRRPEHIARATVQWEVEPDGYAFEGWVNGWSGHTSKAIIHCPEHGSFESSYDKLMRGSRCPACAVTGYRPNRTGYLYCLISDCGGFMKVGITNVPKDRMATLLAATPFAFTIAATLEYEDGAEPPKVERTILESTEHSGLFGFDGSTEWRMYDPATVEWFAG